MPSVISHSIHCLTDGSEYTGCTTLLLEITRDSQQIRRYALCGLSSLSARLSADQRVPLNNVAAVFAPTLESLDGFASLLLTLSQAGAAKLVIVGANIESVTTPIMTSHRRQFPIVTTCNVPIDGEWYLVYTDEYLIVHSKSCSKHHLLFVYTIENKRSFAVVPFTTTHLEPLPDFVMERHKPEKQLHPLMCCIVTDATTNTITTIDRNNPMVLYTQPSTTILDQGLLMRAAGEARQLHQVLPWVYSFPFPTQTRKPSKVWRQLVSCSTLDLKEMTISTERRTEIENASIKPSHNETTIVQPIPIPIPIIMMDPIQQQWQSTFCTDDNEIELEQDEESTQNTATYRPVPHLLVLGTGCASPSPRRGSSGYALFCPTANGVQSLLGVLDCGEGFLTNLSRHLPPVSFQTIHDHLQSVRFIWISHSHLDHYGGLPSLVREIARVRLAAVNDEPSAKRIKMTSAMTMSSLIVIAPSKVLQYLDTILQCSHGKLAESGLQLYQGVTHAALESSPFSKDIRDALFGIKIQHPSNISYYQPIQLLRSVPVHHCPCAHGLILGIQVPGSSVHMTICYSGDTRPCASLVRACHDMSSPLMLLLHEATFDDDDRGQDDAKKKRHSTVMEALGVAHRVSAEACLMTHFSQRYPHHPPGCGMPEVGFAQDGMCLPLTREALVLLPELSTVTNMILSGSEPTIVGT